MLLQRHAATATACPAAVATHVRTSTHQRCSSNAASSSAGIQGRARLSASVVARAAPADEPAPAAAPPAPAAAAAAAVFDYEEPETAKEGIELGLVMCKQGNWQQALGVFEKSLTLPGTGIKRFRDKPPLISDGERMALLFNIACCHSRLQDARSGLVALGGCLEAGYTDFNQVRTDPDLEFLRSDSRFEGLMERFQKANSGFLGGFDLGGLFKK